MSLTKLSNIYHFVKEVRDIIEAMTSEPAIHLQLGLTNINKKVCNLCNISESKVKKVKNEENKENKSPTPTERKKPGKKPIPCDQFTVSMIRRVTQETYAKCSYPTLDSILTECKRNEHFPKISRELFRRWLHSGNSNIKGSIKIVL